MIVNKLDLVSPTDAFFERLERAYTFLSSTNLAALPVGKVSIEGDELFANVQEYYTRPSETVLYENHDRYADVQHIVFGREQIFVTDSNHIGVISVPYDKSGDITYYDSNSTPHHVLYMHEGESAVFLPSDYHKTQCSVDPKNPEPVKKVIVKVKL